MQLFGKIRRLREIEFRKIQKNRIAALNSEKNGALLELCIQQKKPVITQLGVAGFFSEEATGLDVPVKDSTCGLQTVLLLALPTLRNVIYVSPSHFLSSRVGLLPSRFRLASLLLKIVARGMLLTRRRALASSHGRMDRGSAIYPA